MVEKREGGRQRCDEKHQRRGNSLIFFSSLIHCQIRAVLNHHRLCIIAPPPGAFGYFFVGLSLKMYHSARLLVSDYSLEWEFFTFIFFSRLPPPHGAHFRIPTHSCRASSPAVRFGNHFHLSEHIYDNKLIWRIGPEAV